MLSPIIKSKIEEQYGSKIRYSRDCDALSANIFDKTKQTVSGSTLKRLFGFVKGTQEPRTYTLDMIAEYLGYNSYDELLKEFNDNSNSEFNQLQEIIANTIKKGQKIRFNYEPNREVIIECTDKKIFKVIKSVSSKLKLNDSIKFTNIVRSYPLFISEVIRENQNLGQYVDPNIT